MFRSPQQILLLILGREQVQEVQADLDWHFREYHGPSLEVFHKR